MIETKLNGESKDILNENIETLKDLFPEIVAEDKIDFEKFKMVFGGEIDDSSERYSFTWPGKSQAIKEAQKQSTGTLRPCKEESKNWDTTQNLYIEGDNLEVLKLLQKSYYGKIKMIYIDPPYNTGKEFIYTDNYKDNLENYLKISGQVSSERERERERESIGIKLTSNTETQGRYHSNWLNMMYPRLKLARNLLKEDGVIFISIDDNEVDNLKKICDEIFGEDNFIATICQKSRGGISNDKIISENHNYQLFYALNRRIIEKNRAKYGVKKTQKDFKRFNKDDGDGKGKYSLNPVSGPGGARKGNPYYNFLGVEGYFRFSKKTMSDLYDKGKIVKVNNNLYQKTYLNDLKDKVKKISTWWDNAGTTSSGTKVIKELFSENPIFDYPKPVELIKLMIEYSDFKHDDIILDFFSGSSTTAHALMKSNQEDSFNGKFIMVQVPERTGEKSEAYKAGYKTICEIGKERIRRAGDKILEESDNKDLDIGFKVFKLDSSNLEKWDPDYNNLEQTLLTSKDNIKPDRSQEDLIYEIMLKYGVDLTLPIEKYEIADNIIYSIGFGALLICLDDNITKKIADEIIKLGSEGTRVVFKDNGFESDSEKTNIKEILKTNKIEEFITI